MKHDELLRSDELVMPLKYKYLVQQMTSLDSALSFHKYSRKQECVQFSEVCDSVRASFGRDMNVNIFRQILTIVPEFYTHLWINNKLTINTNQDLRIIEVTQKREEVIKQRLLAICIECFRNHC